MAAVMLLMLCAVCAACIWLWETKAVPLAAAPAVTLCTCMVWLSLAGCLGFLLLGGVAALCCAAGCALWLALRRRGALRRALAQPAFVFFVGGSIFFIVLFALRRPMFYQWDEFTFWGSAAKTVCQYDALYTTAPNNMVTQAYPPGLPVLVYLFEFPGVGFAEWGAYAAYDILALACMAAVCQGEDRRENIRNVLLLAACALLPLFFDRARGSEAVSTVYLNLQADLTLGLLFGAALCIYYGQKRTTSSLLQTLAVLAALSLTKDMGMALGLIATGIIAADMLACGWREQKIFGLRGGKGVLAACAGLGCVALAGFFGWSLYVGRVAGQDRFDLGNSGGESLGMVDMMLQGTKELLGIGRTEQFTSMAQAMNEAFLHRQVCLLGPGLAVAALMALLLAAAFVGGDRLLRRRVVAYGVVSTLGFAAFWIFHLFLYLYVFGGAEGQELKDYARYFLAWHMGWLLGALALLGQSGRLGKKLPTLAAAGLLAVVAGAFLWRGQVANNFATTSNTLYSERVQVEQRAQLLNDAVGDGERVYLVCQSNDGTRWYYYGYGLRSTLLQMYGGGDGSEQAPWRPTTAATLVEKPFNDQQYEVVCDSAALTGYLRESGATVLLVDRGDDYVAGLLGPYTDGPFEESGLAQPAAYRISWPQGELRLEPLEWEVQP